MNCLILSIGDELVLGQTVDTNSAWLSQQLSSIGIAVVAHVTVADDQSAIERAVANALEACDVLLISGGLGPTEDDLTRQALAAVLNAPLELNDAWLVKLKAFFELRGRTMPPSNAIQAMIPRGASLIDNSAGTAPGIAATMLRDSKSMQIFVMPGVPKEMKIMFQRDVFPALKAKGGGGVILSRTLHTFGLGESHVAEMLGPLMARHRNPSVGTTVANGIVSLRLNSRFDNPDEALSQLEATDAECRTALGDVILGSDEQTLPSIVAGLLLFPGPSNHPLTVTTAESCTGGWLSKMLTDTPGSSAYFKQGWVTYSNDAKYDRLGINRELLNVYGAVSEPVASLMASNARRLAKSDFALAVSGIAGPDGGTPTKPVGTVCIALASAEPQIEPAAPRNFVRSAVAVRTFIFTGDREFVRFRSAMMALTMLRFAILQKPMPF